MIKLPFKTQLQVVMNLSRILTFFIVIIKELEFDIFQVCIVEIFSYNTFVIFNETRQDKLFVTHHESNLGQNSRINKILTQKKDSRKIFSINVKLLIFGFFVILKRKKIKNQHDVWGWNTCSHVITHFSIYHDKLFTEVGDLFRFGDNWFQG